MKLWQVWQRWCVLKSIGTLASFKLEKSTFNQLLIIAFYFKMSVGGDLWVHLCVQKFLHWKCKFSALKMQNFCSCKAVENALRMFSVSLVTSTDIWPFSCNLDAIFFLMGALFCNLSAFSAYFILHSSVNESRLGYNIVMLILIWLLVLQIHYLPVTVLQ